MIIRNFKSQIVWVIINCLSICGLFSQGNSFCHCDSVSNVVLKNGLYYSGDNLYTGNDTCIYLPFIYRINIYESGVKVKMVETDLRKSSLVLQVLNDTVVDGLYARFNNGRISRMEEWIDDSFTGSYISFNERGNISAIIGFCPQISFYKNTRVNEIISHFNYQKGRQFTMKFDTCGVLQSYIEFYYFKNEEGREYFYEDGKFIEYYSSGLKKTVGYNNRSKKNGEWLYYNEAGKLIKTENWENGILIGINE